MVAAPICDPSADRIYEPIVLGMLTRVGLGKDLVVGVDSQGNLLGFQHEVELRTPNHGCGGAGPQHEDDSAEGGVDCRRGPSATSHDLTLRRLARVPDMHRPSR